MHLHHIQKVVVMLQRTQVKTYSSDRLHWESYLQFMTLEALAVLAVLEVLEALAVLEALEQLELLEPLELLGGAALRCGDDGAPSLPP